VRKKEYHQLNECVPLGKNPRENEIRHPDITSQVAEKDVKQKACKKNKL